MKLRILWIALVVAALTAVPALAQKGGAVPEGMVEFRQWASAAEATTQFGSDSWSAMQATGTPNVSDCGDFGGAWASESATGKDDLTVFFDTPVVPTQINIHQTYNPGAITGIELILADGSGNVQVTGSADPGVQCPGILIIDILSNVDPVDGVIIHLDQTLTGSWNEIDAVELVGLVEEGTEVGAWASFAEATSQYGPDSYSALQATGTPDTNFCGDATTAWASETSTGQESLTVYYDYALVPTQVNVYQNFNPGAITGIELILADGSGNVEVTGSADPGTGECPGVLTIDILSAVDPVSGVVVHLDQSKINNWNEIDAVQLVGQIQAQDQVRQWATSAFATSQYGEDSWSALQATGLPDTAACGDFTTAWASLTATGKDSLTVLFDEAVIPTQVNIYQTFNPGAITGIELILADGSGNVQVTGSADPGNIECPGVLTIDILSDVDPVNGVVIHLDQSITGSWNEIDAVELVGEPA